MPVRSSTATSSSCCVFVEARRDRLFLTVLHRLPEHIMDEVLARRASLLYSNKQREPALPLRKGSVRSPLKPRNGGSRLHYSSPTQYLICWSFGRAGYCPPLSSSLFQDCFRKLMSCIGSLSSEEFTSEPVSAATASSPRRASGNCCCQSTSWTKCSPASLLYSNKQREPALPLRKGSVRSPLKPRNGGSRLHYSSPTQYLICWSFGRAGPPLSSSLFQDCFRKLMSCIGSLCRLPEGPQMMRCHGRPRPRE